ncbi:NAD(P)/FAD-dependent oxidoreductase [Cryptosporangium sp. NPDC051539]|uniref:NAD(P)/FAD-dependent oxidoreductase n=1 Tax=Cryptosporangium sp. NPDC051539 TaxID=3363962 RepID=UPI0037A297E4
MIIGAGLAGVRTAEGLRRRGFPGAILVLGAETHLPYDRPPLSKQFLGGTAGPSWLSSLADLARLDVTVSLDEPAVALSVTAQTVSTPSRTVGFDLAVIATGSQPRRLPGLNGLVLRTLDDAARLRASLLPGKRLGIVGAGLIGCEVAATARERGMTVHLVDVAPGPAIRVLGPTVSSTLAEIHRRHGVQLHFGRSVTRPAPDRLRLADGTELAVDLVLEAVGAVPCTGWLAGSGLAAGDGVVCDEHGRAATNVYAVGDVAGWRGRRHEHWSAACRQADHVAATITGQAAPPAGVPYWWSDQYGYKLQGLGDPRPDDQVTEFRWGAKQRPVALYSRDGRLTGAVGFSAAGFVMRLRDPIARAVPLREVSTA